MRIPAQLCKTHLLNPLNTMTPYYFTLWRLSRGFWMNSVESELEFRFFAGSREWGRGGHFTLSSNPTRSPQNQSPKPPGCLPCLCKARAGWIKAFSWIKVIKNQPKIDGRWWRRWTSIPPQLKVSVTRKTHPINDFWAGPGPAALFPLPPNLQRRSMQLLAWVWDKFYPRM